MTQLKLLKIENNWHAKGQRTNL